MKKLIIIPAYNESESILDTIADIKKNASDFDYIVINDCSKDNTLEILVNNNINHLDLGINLGIGGAMQAGYKYAYYNDYDYAVQVDGDGQHDVSYLKDMENKLVEEKASMVIGSRFIENQGFQSTALRRVGISYFTKLIKLLTGKVVSDPTSGFRMIDKKTIELFAFDYPRDYPEPEAAMMLLKNGYKVVECPVKMRERQGGQSSINAGKSVYYMIKVTLAIFFEKIRSPRGAHE